MVVYEETAANISHPPVLELSKKTWSHTVSFIVPCFDFLFASYEHICLGSIARVSTICCEYSKPRLIRIFAKSGYDWWYE